MKILIADDHPIYRGGLKQFLCKSFKEVVVDEATNGNEALNKISKSDYDVVLLDIDMPGRSGLEIVKDVKKEKPKLPVLMLSAYPEEQYALRSLKSGASGYLTKKSVPGELIKAIKKVSQGGKYITSSIAERLAFTIEDEDANIPPQERLSNREHQVMCMIAHGRSGKEISEELSLSESTVSTYRTRILEKMGMKKNSELISYAIKNELIE